MPSEPEKPEKTWVIRRSTADNLKMIVDVSSAIVPGRKILEERKEEQDKMYSLLERTDAQGVLKYIHKHRKKLDLLFSPGTVRELILFFDKLRKHTLRVLEFDLRATLESEVNAVLAQQINPEDLEQQTTTRDWRDFLVDVILSENIESGLQYVDKYCDDIDKIFGIGIARDVEEYLKGRDEAAQEAYKRRAVYRKIG